jgi:hypothetical protein
METEFIKTLVNQAPGLAVAAFIVWQFLKNMKERDQMFIEQTADRDKLFIEQMNKVVERLQSLENFVIQHDASSRNAWQTRKDTLDRIEKKLDARQRRQLSKKQNE